MEDTVRVLQLTDTHLKAGLDDELMGAHVDRLFHRVHQHAVSNEPMPDVMLMTGDLAQDASLEVYHRLRDYLSGFQGPQRWLPGNHDNLDIMREAVPEFTQPVLDIGAWRIVCLSTLVPGKVGGHLSDHELETLAQALETTGERHVLVALHHPLVEINAAWLDEQRVDNGEQALQLISRYPQAKAVLGGHIHQELDKQYRGVRLLATPSTWVQFAQESDDFGLDEIAPGYRWLELHGDGSITTRVERVGGPAPNVDYSRGSGY